MNILTKSSVFNNETIDQIRKYIPLFGSFKHVFIFGSVLELNIVNNDVDILIIYKEYSNQLKNDLVLFTNELTKTVGMFVDITSLSVEEEKETKFLDRISSRCLRLK